MMKINDFLDKPLNKLILWFSLGFIIFLVGIIQPKADSFNYNDFTAQLYDNSNGSLSAVTTDFTNASWRGTIPYMVANSSGAAWGISSGKPLLANHTYSFTIQIEGPYGGRIVLSTYNRIGVGTSLGNAKTSYQNNSYVTENYSNANGDNGVLQFAFTPSINGSYIVFPFGVSSTGSNQQYWISSFIIEDLGSGGVSETTINNSLNSQTNIINGSISTSENNIRSAIGQTEQNIIDNQNQNSNAIESQLGSCYLNLFQKNYDSTIRGFKLSGLTAGKQYKFYSNLEFSWFKIAASQYASSAYEYASFNVKELVFTAPANVNDLYLFLGSSVDYSNNTSYFNTYGELMLFESPFPSSPTYVDYNQKYCTSKIDDVTDTLKDDDVDSSNATDTLSSLSNSVASNSVISDLLLLPVRLFQNIVNNINGSCSSFNLGTLYNTNLSLPCINIPNIIGETLWTVIDILFCGSFILVIRKKFVDIFESLSELKNGGNAVE